MANMFWENAAGGRVLMPTPGQILLMRGNTVQYDYSDTRVSASDYGDGLKAAFAAAIAGDVISVGAGEFEISLADLSTSNVTLLFNGTILKQDTNYDDILIISGDDVVCRGLTIRCGGTANTGSGTGLQVSGDRCQILDCECSGVRAAANSHALEVSGNDTIVDGFYSDDAGYAGIRNVHGKRNTYRNVSIVNPLNRALNVEANAADIDWIQIENFSTVADKSGTHTGINFNTIFTVGHAILNHVSITLGDIFAAGVSYDSPSGDQPIKFQNINRLSMEGCTFKHGTNQGAGVSRSINFDTGIPEVSIKDTYCSSGIKSSNPGSKHGTFHVSDSSIGVDSNETGVLFDDFYASDLSIERCRLDVQGGSGVASISSSWSAGDRFSFVNNNCLGNLGTDQQVLIDTDIESSIGYITCHSNTLTNSGAGDFVLSNDNEVNMMLSTDAAGNILFDDTAIGAGMPSPGSGPVYFGAMPVGPNGSTIVNVNWSPDGTQVIPESRWIAHDAEWKEYADSGLVIHEDAVALTQRSIINFGFGLKASDNSGSGRTDISTIGNVVTNGGLGATPTIDWTAGYTQTAQLTADITTLTFTSPTEAVGDLYLLLIQDGTGGWTIDWTGGPTVTGPLPFIHPGISSPTLLRLSYDGLSYIIQSSWDGALDAGNKTGASTLDLSYNTWQQITLTGNVTSWSSWTDPVLPGPVKIQVYQDVTGGRTLAAPSKTFSGGNPFGNIDTAANAPSLLKFDWDGAVYHTD